MAELERCLQERDSAISVLQCNFKTSQDIANKLNKELNRIKVQNHEHIADIIKEHRADIKQRKKDYGKLKSENIKLKKKLDALPHLTYVDRKDSRNESLNSHRSEKVSSTVTKCNLMESTSEDHLSCSICAVTLFNYVPTYFCGEKVNPSCVKCLGDDGLDTFFSFPTGMPTSLVSHWIPSHEECEFGKCSLSSIASMKSHYVRIPDPGGSFSAMEDLMQKFRILFNQ